MDGDTNFKTKARRRSSFGQGRINTTLSAADGTSTSENFSQNKTREDVNNRKHVLLQSFNDHMKCEQLGWKNLLLKYEQQASSTHFSEYSVTCDSNRLEFANSKHLAVIQSRPDYNGILSHLADCEEVAEILVSTLINFGGTLKQTVRKKATIVKLQQQSLDQEAFQHFNVRFD